jgi:predicted MFS family arabinose efflux permease
MIRGLVVAGALLVVAQLHRAGGGVISSELNRAFGLSAADIGVVIGAMMLASAVIQVPMGLAFDRYGTRRTTAAFTLVALAGTLAFALAGDAAGLAAGRFLIGIGFGGPITVIMLLAMRWAPRERFATVAASVIASASLLGGLLGTAPLAFALQRLGWAATFGAIALLTLCGAGLVFALVRDAPADDPAPAPGPESLLDSLRGLRALLVDAGLRPVLIIGVCTIAPFACVAGLWAGPYLQDVHGLDRTQASFALLGLVVAYNLGTLGYGPLDRAFGTHKGVIVAGAGLSALGLAALALWPQPPLWPAIVILHLAVLAMPFYVTLTGQVREVVPPQRLGRAITSLYLSGLSAAFLAQWLTGLLVGLTADAGRIGSPLGYRLVFGFLAIMLCGTLLVYRRAPEGRMPTRAAGAIPTLEPSPQSKSTSPR